MRAISTDCVSAENDPSIMPKTLFTACVWGAVWIAMWGLFPGAACAIGPLFRGPDPYGPQTDDQTRASAIEAIPRDLMTAEALAKVDAVLADTTLFRRMPIRVVQCDPDLYLFLVRQPDVVVNIWDVLKLSKLSMRQTGPATYDVIDHAGTNGTVEFLYQNADTHVIYSEGSYEGPLIARPVTGRTLIVLKTGYVREADGSYHITNRLDTFMQVDRRGVELVTKTLHPLIGKVADLNFSQTVNFVGSLSKTAEVDPDGMQRLANRLTKVSPEARLRFALISNDIALKAAELAASSQTHGSAVVSRPQSAAVR